MKPSEFIYKRKGNIITRAGYGKTPEEIMDGLDKNFISKEQHEKELNKLSNNLSRGINRESLKLKDYKQKVLDLINKFDFKKYSLCVNPIQEKEKFRQLRKELKQKIKEMK